MHPRLEAGKELNELGKGLCHFESSEFEKHFNDWCAKWDDFLKEKTVISGSNWFYTHRRLRSANRSIKTNLPYLLTYQKYTDLKIPNTINCIESLNSRIKELIHVHRGSSRRLKEKIISEILEK